VLHPVPEEFQDDVGPVDEPYSAADGLGQCDLVAPERVTVTVEVIEDDVDRLARALGRAPLGATFAQGGGQVVDGGLDVAQLGDLLGRVG